MATVLPDGYPFSDEDLLYNKIMNPSVPCTMNDVCYRNVLCTRIRSSIRVHKASRRMSAFSSVSSSNYRRTSESSALFSLPSYSSAHCLTSLVNPTSERVLHLREGEGVKGSDDCSSNDERRRFRGSMTSGTYSSSSRDLSSGTAGQMNLPSYATPIIAAANLQSGKNAKKYPHLVELRSLLFESACEAGV